MKLRHFNDSVLKVNQTVSTNALLWEMLSVQPCNNGFSIIAEAQTKGKGQKGNSWVTEPGKNLTTSIYCLPNLEVKNAFYLNIISSLALRKTLSDIGIEALIKWPNDIMVARKKIAGILVENQIQGQNIKNSVIGIGVNVNQKVFAIERPITSIYQLKNKPHSVDELFTNLHQNLDFYFDLLIHKQFSLLKKQYLSHLYQINEISEYCSSEKGRFLGTIMGIKDNGRLVVKTIDGIELAFDMQTIQFL